MPKVLLTALGIQFKAPEAAAPADGSAEASGY
jgi:hypothetical protein